MVADVVAAPEPFESTFSGEVGSGGLTEGWALQSLRRSIRTAVLVGAGSAQLLMIVAVAMAPPSRAATVPLIIAHLGVAGLAFGAQLGRVPAHVFLVALDVVILSGFVVADSIDSVHVLAVTWMMNLAYVFPGFLLDRRRDRWLFSGLIALVVPFGIYLAHPEWREPLVLPAVVTGTAMALAVGVAIKALDEFAGRVDAQVESSAAKRRAAAAMRTATFEGAERARVLHDTVINTLGAVANGGGAALWADDVRDRCARDVPVVEALLQGQALPEIVSSVEEVAAQLGLHLQRTGLDDVEVSQLVATVPGEVLSALVAATRESIVNVARHAGVGCVELDVDDSDRTLRVTVTDRGVGFDGRPVPGRGLAESVVARCEQAGIDVSIRSEIGSGTRVQMRLPLRPADPTLLPDMDDVDFRATVTGIHHRSSWAWALAVVAIGMVIEGVNRFGQLTATYGMLAIGGACLAFSWLDVRRRGDMSTITQALLVAMVPASFLLGLAGVDFGRVDIILWQAIGVTGPLVLLTQAPSRIAFAAGMVALGATAVAAAAVMMVVESSDTAAIVLVGAAPAAWVAGAWLVFHEAVERIGERAVDEQRASLQDRAELAEVEAAEVARKRWRHAGLQGCHNLLTALSSGRADPTDHGVRAACSDEERYLRQLTLLNPTLVHLGFWMARSLSLARSRHVSLVVRTGGVDVDEQAGSAFGELLERAIVATPPQTELTVTLFVTRNRLRLAVVGPGPAISTSASDWVPPAGWRVSVQMHDRFGIIEVVHDVDALSKVDDLWDVEALV